MAGSMRERGKGTWELRVYAGRDDKGRAVMTQRTVRATSRRAAEKLLAAFVTEQAAARPAAGTVSALIDRWLDHITLKGLERIGRPAECGRDFATDVESERCASVIHESLHREGRHAGLPH